VKHKNNAGNPWWKSKKKTQNLLRKPEHRYVMKIHGDVNKINPCKRKIEKANSTKRNWPGNRYGG